MTFVLEKRREKSLMVESLMEYFPLVKGLIIWPSSFVSVDKWNKSNRVMVNITYIVGPQLSETSLTI